jgi:hypothetical protein
MGMWGGFTSTQEEMHTSYRSLIFITTSIHLCSCSIVYVHMDTVTRYYSLPHTLPQLFVGNCCRLYNLNNSLLSARIYYFLMQTRV